MSKKVDWDAHYRTPLRGKLDTGGRFTSARQMFEESNRVAEQRATSAQQMAAIEPLLKKALFEHMVSRKPIMVISSFNYITDHLEKSNNRFSEVMAPIHSGTVLRFERINKSLKQWIFKSATGEEFEIYDAPAVHFQNTVITNPAWVGLLRNTSIFEEVRNQLAQQRGESGEEEE